MWGIRGTSAWLTAFTLNYRSKHPATYGRHKPRTLRLKYAQVRIYQLENRYHFWDSLKLTNKYPILSKDLKEPLLSIKTSQEHTRLPCVVCFKRKFPKKLTIDFRFLGIILPEVSGNWESPEKGYFSPV